MKYSYFVEKFSRTAPVLYIYILVFNYSCKVKKKKNLPISNNAILSSLPFFSFFLSSSFSSFFFFFYLIEVGLLDFQETRNHKSNYQKERKKRIFITTLLFTWPRFDYKSRGRNVGLNYLSKSNINLSPVKLFPR